MVSSGSFNVHGIRSLFPIIGTEVRGKNLVYLDSAATTLKPQAVIDAVTKYYARGTANVHRGIHFLSDQATSDFEAARESVRRLLNASADEIVFTHGTTESINLVAAGLTQSQNHGGTTLPAWIGAGDEILLTEMEHHSNLVPWQMAAERVCATVRFAPVSEAGEIVFEEFEKMLSKKTKILALTAASNTLGTINPVARMVKAAHSVGAKVMVDAAQAVANFKIDVKDWNCDFLAFSGHKLFGPTGVGVLYGRHEALQSLPPFMGGGSMIDKVTFERTTYLDAPFRFEAGTPHIAGVIGLGAAIEFVTSVGFKEIAEHEESLSKYANEKLSKIPRLKLVGRASQRVPIFSFVVEGVHHQDLGSVLDQEGIAIRTGHHCTQPLLAKFGLTGTARASFSLYSTREEIDVLCMALDKAIRLLE